jgi:mRNA interferase RelE/StbE
MGSYQINWRRSTKKDLRRISASKVGKIVETVATLSIDPRPLGCKKLTGSECAYRLRVGNYRIIYEVYDDTVIIEIIKVGHRSDVYRK